MPGSHWMVVTTPENFEITRQRGFDLLGLKARHRKKAERMAPGDHVLFYISHVRAFPATVTITSSYFEDHRVIWQNNERRPDDFPWRVKMAPDIVLPEHEYIDAYDLAPRLAYVKRWAPEDWPLAFQGQIHLLSSADFSMIEREMRRIIEQHRGPRDLPPRRPRQANGGPSRDGERQSRRLDYGAVPDEHTSSAAIRGGV